MVGTCRTARRSQFEDALDILGIQGSSAESSGAGGGAPHFSPGDQSPSLLSAETAPSPQRPWAPERRSWCLPGPTSSTSCVVVLSVGLKSRSLGNILKIEMCIIFKLIFLTFLISSLI